MKKAITIVLAMVLVLVMGVSVCAAPNSFVSSPSAKGPTIVEAIPDDPNCGMQLILTPYEDRDTLPEDQRKMLEKAYDDIANADDLTALWEELAKLAKENNIPGSKLAVSDLFHIHGEGCDDHDGHNGHKVKLDADSMNHFVALMQQDKDGNWSTVKGAYVDKDGYLVFHLDEVPTSLAIVVNTDKESPQVGGIGHIYVYAVLMVASALAIVVLVVKSKKYA